jgi:hypothetical protein
VNRAKCQSILPFITGFSLALSACKPVAPSAVKDDGGDGTPAAPIASISLTSGPTPTSQLNFNSTGDYICGLSGGGSFACPTGDGTAVITVSSPGTPSPVLCTARWDISQASGSFTFEACGAFPGGPYSVQANVNCSPSLASAATPAASFTCPSQCVLTCGTGNVLTTADWSTIYARQPPSFGCPASTKCQVPDTYDATKIYREGDACQRFQRPEPGVTKNYAGTCAP